MWDLVVIHSSLILLFLWPQVSCLNSVLLTVFMAPFCKLVQVLLVKRLL